MTDEVTIGGVVVGAFQVIARAELPPAGVAPVPVLLETDFAQIADPGHPVTTQSPTTTG